MKILPRKALIFPLVGVGVATAATLAIPSSDAAPAADPTASSCVFSATSFPEVLPPNCQQVGDVIGVSLASGGEMEFGLSVPADGLGAQIAVERAAGPGYELSVLNASDAHPTAELSAAQSVPTSSATSPTKCKDGAYNFSLDTPPGETEERKVLIETSYNWYSNLASTPSNVSRTKALAGLKHAAAAISNTASTCDERDLNPKPQTYMGDKPLAGNVTQASCDLYGSTDNINNVVFGPLTSTNTLAATCRWLKESSPSPNYWLVKEADVRFKSSGYSWKFADETCVTGYSLVGVATHEFGHVYGLGHVAEAGHANLTMSESSGPCEFDQVNLGLGDVSGIARMYGTAY